MGQYYKNINDYFEDKARILLNNCLSPDYSVERNNLYSNDIDLKVCDSFGNTTHTIDVQYSANFSYYGDVRIDLMSAGWLVKDNHKKIWQINKDIKNSINSLQYFKSLFKIDKYGKYFIKENNRMIGVFYYFYNDNIEKKIENFTSREPDYMFFLPKRIALQEIKENPNLIIKINDKQSNGIYESHHSAFACLRVADLCQKYGLQLFKTGDEMRFNFMHLFATELSYLC